MGESIKDEKREKRGGAKTGYLGYCRSGKVEMRIKEKKSRLFMQVGQVSNLHLEDDAFLAGG
jgi:hypothetical protein